MDQSMNKLLTYSVIALVIGVGAGYYIGYGQGIASEKAAREARQAEAEKKAAETVNPFEQTTVNPFEKAPVNPFKNIQTNPFE